jgi:hypothetical protein
MRILLKILLYLAALALLLVVLAFGCVYILESLGPGIATERIRAMTGFRLDMASLKLSLLKCSAEIDGANLRNPKGWPEEDFVTINRALVDIKPLSYIGERRREIDEVIIDLGQINLVTDSHGKNNAEEFLAGLKPAKGEAAPSKEITPKGEKKAEKPPHGYIIRRLVLKTSSVRYVDYSQPNSGPVVIPLNCEIELNNVTDLKQVRKKLLSRISRSFLMGLLESTQWNTGGC